MNSNFQTVEQLLEELEGVSDPDLLKQIIANYMVKANEASEKIQDLRNYTSSKATTQLKRQIKKLKDACKLLRKKAGRRQKRVTNLENSKKRLYKERNRLRQEMGTKQNEATVEIEGLLTANTKLSKKLDQNCKEMKDKLDKAQNDHSTQERSFKKLSEAVVQLNREIEQTTKQKNFHMNKAQDLEQKLLLEKRALDEEKEAYKRGEATIAQMQRNEMDMEENAGKLRKKIIQLEDEIKRLKDELKENPRLGNSSLKEKEERLISMEKTNNTLARTIEEKNEKLSEMEQRNDVLGEDVEEVKKRLLEMEQKNTILSKTIEDLRLKLSQYKREKDSHIQIEEQDSQFLGSLLDSINNTDNSYGYEDINDLSYVAATSLFSHSTNNMNTSPLSHELSAGTLIKDPIGPNSYPHAMRQRNIRNPQTSLYQPSPLRRQKTVARNKQLVPPPLPVSHRTHSASYISSSEENTPIQVQTTGSSSEEIEKTLTKNTKKKKTLLRQVKDIIPGQSAKKLSSSQPSSTL